MSSGLALVTVGPRVGEETDLCSALLATNVTNDVAQRRGSGAALCHSPFIDNAFLLHCRDGHLKTLHTGEAG